MTSSLVSAAEYGLKSSIYLAEPSHLFVVCFSEWKPAVDLAAIDCAATETRQICFDYGVKGYPTIKVQSGGTVEKRRSLDLFSYSICRQ